MWNGFKVIDSDAHHHEPMDMWDRYLEPEYRERVPKVIGMQRNFYVYAQDNQLSPVLEAGSPIPAHHDKWMADKYGEAYDRWWSPDVRLKDMDRYGWDIQVILSTNANRVMESAIKNPQVGGAMARAYHNWCHDYASADPARLKFTATLPAGDSKAMVAEARRAVETLGAVSVRNPLLPPANGCTSLNTMPCGSSPAISIFRSLSMASHAMFGRRRFARCAQMRGLSARSTT